MNISEDTIRKAIDVLGKTNNSLADLITSTEQGDKIFRLAQKSMTWLDISKPPKTP